MLFKTMTIIYDIKIKETERKEKGTKEGIWSAFITQ